MIHLSPGNFGPKADADSRGNRLLDSQDIIAFKRYIGFKADAFAKFVTNFPVLLGSVKPNELFLDIEQGHLILLSILRRIGNRQKNSLRRDKGVIARDIVKFRSVRCVSPHANVENFRFFVLDQVDVQIVIIPLVFNNRLSNKRRCGENVQRDIIILFIRAVAQELRKRYQLFIDRAKLLVEKSTVLRESDISSLVLEQGNSQFVFKLVNRWRQGRLDDAKILGALRHVFRSGNFQKIS